MPVTSRSIVVPITAVVLGICATLGALAAFRSPHVGAGVLALAAAIFATAAVGVSRRALWASLFGLFFCSVVGVGVLVVAAFSAKAAADAPRVDLGFLEMLVYGALALVSLTVGAALLACAFGLGRALLAAKGSSVPAWLASVGAAVVLIGLVGWIVGVQYVHRALWKQNDCFAGSGLACYELATADRSAAPLSSKSRQRPGLGANGIDFEGPRFRPAERAEFARRGCVAGNTGSCEELAYAIAAGTLALGGDGDVASDIVAGQCAAGKPHLCLKLAGALFQAGAADRAPSYLTSACEASAVWCEPGAELAAKRSAGAIAQALRESGCQRDEPSSCRGLVWHGRASSDAAARATLELKSCLIGDVNDCLPLIRRDARAVCPQICAGQTELRGQSCWHCAEQARQNALVDLADAWQAQACAAGYRAGCAGRPSALVRARPTHKPSVEMNAPRRP